MYKTISELIDNNPKTVHSFWTKVKINSPFKCWEWLAYKNHNGYGMFRQRRAHRIVWSLVNGLIPDEIFVLHKCDNPSCVNPGHLFLGTQVDNMRDKMEKGRHRWGSGNAKLTSKQVKAIRIMGSRHNMLQKDIANIFSMTQSQISRVLAKKCWICSGNEDE